MAYKHQMTLIFLLFLTTHSFGMQFTNTISAEKFQKKLTGQNNEDLEELNNNAQEAYTHYYDFLTSLEEKEFSLIEERQGAVKKQIDKNLLNIRGCIQNTHGEEAYINTHERLANADKSLIKNLSMYFHEEEGFSTYDGPFSKYKFIEMLLVNEFDKDIKELLPPYLKALLV